MRFKTPIPGLGNASPIVWGDRIFVTTAVSARGESSIRTGLYGDGTSVDDVSEHSFRLYALDKSTGRVLWEREAHRAAPAARRHVKASQANSTPATDGRRVVALFGTVGRSRPTTSRASSWKRDVGVLDCGDPAYGGADWGHASSPVIHGDVVIVQGDRQQGLVPRRLPPGRRARPGACRARSPPPGPPRTSCGARRATSSSPTERRSAPTIPRRASCSGRLGPNSEVVVATPVRGARAVFVTAGYPPVRPVYAVRPGHRGDLTLPDGQPKSEAVAWSHARGGTYLPTPLLYGDQLYTVNNNGLLTSYRAGDGRAGLPDAPRRGGASLRRLSGRRGRPALLPRETGEVYVLRAGPEFELVATNEMDEIVMASPAISDGLLVVRTLAHVVGIGEHDKRPRRRETSSNF